MSGETRVRVIVYGAGAIGGLIGGRLAEHDHDVVLIARGAHHDAIRDGGLRVDSPDSSITLKIPVVDRPEAITFADSDIVILAMKGQDTTHAVAALAAAAPPGLPVVCAQNGVANERIALRAFANVYGMHVMCPATHLAPGLVEGQSTPIAGLLDLGRYPSGVDDTAVALAAALEASTFSSNALDDIMPWKHRKLLSNLGNSVDAACEMDDRAAAFAAQARTEAEACYAAAGITAVTEEEDRARRGDLLRMRPIEGRRRGGGSSWQSLERGTGSIEADYLNGEIVLLGRLHGVPTPVNAALQQVANRMAREHLPPRSLTVDDIEAAVAASTTV
jgi:2-dehydropantoate 2-reductase